MVSKTVWWILTGAALFHAVTHVFYWISGAVPIDFKWFVVTPTLNQIELWGSVVLGGIFAYLGRKK